VTSSLGTDLSFLGRRSLRERRGRFRRNTVNLGPGYYPIYNYLCSPFTSVNRLVEGSDANWIQGEQNTLTFTVTATAVGTVNLWIRTTPQAWNGLQRLQ